MDYDKIRVVLPVMYLMENCSSWHGFCTAEGLSDDFIKELSSRPDGKYSGSIKNLRIFGILK